MLLAAVQATDEQLIAPRYLMRISAHLAFLADRTIGRAFGTVCRLSVSRLSVTFCIVAKRYVLAKGANRKPGSKS